MKTTFILYSILALFVCGCASSTQSLQGESAQQERYATVVLCQFSLQDAAISTSEEVQAFAKDLQGRFGTTTEKFLRRVRLPERIVIVKTEAEQGEPVAHAVVVEGRFTRISAGSMAARAFAPRFTTAGAPSLAAEWKIKDAETGKVLGEFERNLRLKSFNSRAESVVLLDRSREYLAEDVAVSIKKVVAKSRSL